MKSSLLFVSLTIILLASCVGSNRYSTMVYEKLWTLPKNEIQEKDQIKVFSNQLSDSSTQIIQERNSFVPAIFYWGWNSTISCDLNDNITTEWLTTSIFEAADSLGLYHKLGQNKLEIHLERVPGKFYYENQGHTIYLIIAYTMSMSETITPDPIDLVATYRIVNEEGLQSKGTIIIPNQEERVGNVLKSTKKFTWSYMDKHIVEIENMGWYLIEEILNRI